MNSATNSIVNKLSESALSLAEEGLDMAVDSFAAVAEEATDIAGDFAVPAVAYGAKRLLSSRIVLSALVLTGVLGALFAWRKRSNTEESVTANIPTVGDRSPASS